MSARTRRLARAWAPEVGIVLGFWGLALLFGGTGGGSPSNAWHSITISFLLSPLLWIAPAGTRSRSWRAASGRGGRGLVALGVAVLFFGRGGPPGAWAGLLLLAACWAMMLTALFLVEYDLLRGRMRGWLVCGVAVVAVLGPFCLDSLLSSRRPVESVIRCRDLALAASPAVAAARTLDLDVFKVEGVYRRCLVGEQIFGYPEPPLTARSYVLCAALLAILAAIPALRRRAGPPGETPASS